VPVHREELYQRIGQCLPALAHAECA
jgi:hypothetical protein